MTTITRPRPAQHANPIPSAHAGSVHAWNSGPQMDEWRTIRAFAGGPVRVQPRGDWIPRSTAELVFVKPSLHDLLGAVSDSLQRAQSGAEILLRTPAWTGEPFALALFEAHSAMCFWQGAHCPTLYTYCGPRLWDFDRAFRARGAVLLRGRGTTGPWSL